MPCFGHFVFVTRVRQNHSVEKSLAGQVWRGSNLAPKTPSSYTVAEVLQTTKKKATSDRLSWSPWFISTSPTSRCPSEVSVASQAGAPRRADVPSEATQRPSACLLAPVPPQSSQSTTVSFAETVLRDLTSPPHPPIPSASPLCGRCGSSSGKGTRYRPSAGSRTRSGDFERRRPGCGGVSR